MRKREIRPLPEKVRRERLAEAEALFAELRQIKQRTNVDSYRRCELLARIRRDRLHEAFLQSFSDFCVKNGFATSARKACAQATLWEKLQVRPALCKVFAEGKADWTLVREAADLADAKVATDEELAELVQTCTWRELQARRFKAQIERGEEPTVDVTFRVKVSVEARLDRVIQVLSARLRSTRGRDLTQGEGLEEVVALVEQMLHTPAPVEEKAPVTRLPEPIARLHGFVEPTTFEALLLGPRGFVQVSRETRDLITCCGERQDAKGKVSRDVPRALQRRLWELDRGMCSTPGCGETRYLQVHHEGGYRERGHDPEYMLHLCTLHHSARHKGWLRIEGRRSTGFRYLRFDGTSLERARAGADPPGAAA